MKRIVSITALCCIALLASAQKTINDPNAELRTVGSFEGIAVSGGIDLYLSAGTEAVAVSASRPEDRNRIHTEVSNGVLKIWYESNSGISVHWGESRKMKAYVSFKTLKNVTASGGSDVSVEGGINTSELRLTLSGGSDFKGKVETDALRVQQSGGSDVNISGRAGTLNVAASGGSDFNGYDLVTDICDVAASGGSDIEITANKELSAQASGASDVHYKGTAQVKNVKASGASSVKAKG